MAHWSDYSLRGWLSFLAFMHVGLCLRSVFDVNFLFGKVFIGCQNQETVLVHYFSLYSLIQAGCLIQSAIHLYVLPVQNITISLLFSFILINLIEGFYFHTLDIYGGTLLPFAMSVISLVWLILFHYVWKPWKMMDTNEDIRGQLFMPHQRRHQNQQHHHHQYHPYHHHANQPLFFLRMPNAAAKYASNPISAAVAAAANKNIKAHSE